MAETTLLEDIETSDRTAFTCSYRDFLDDKEPGCSAASVTFYKIIDDIRHRDYSSRLTECRSRAWFIRNKDTGKVRIAAKQCRLRWCYHCSEAKQQFITQAVLPWFEKALKPKLLTVTIRHSQRPLLEQIEFLYKSFRKFRNRKFLKDRIHGGIWFFQITYNQKRQEWHPHIHALLDSEYLDQLELVSLWRKITLTSDIVHIRAVHDPEKTLSHNARYAARPSALIKIPDFLWPALFDSFNGKRICGTWGTAKDISLRPQKPDDSEKWISIGGWRTVTRSLGFDDNAAAIWKAWLCDKPLNPEISMLEIETFIDGDDLRDRAPPKHQVDQWFESMRGF